MNTDHIKNADVIQYVHQNVLQDVLQSASMIVTLALYLKIWVQVMIILALALMKDLAMNQSVAVQNLIVILLAIDAVIVVANAS